MSGSDSDPKAGPPDGFLSRWSRRKRAVQDEGPETPQSSAPEGVGQQGGAQAVSLVTEASEALPAEPEFDVSSLPDLDTLTMDTDITPFLQKGVPEFLKNAALRKAWVLDPLIRDYIGPVENGWDFNDPNAIPGFGPLEANIDRQAMMRQIFGEKDPPVPGEKDPVSGEKGLVEPAVPAPASTTQAQPQAELAQLLPEPAEDAEDLSDPAAALDLNAAPQQHDMETIEETAPAPRRPRHGGAVPN